MNGRFIATLVVALFVFLIVGAAARTARDEAREAAHAGAQEAFGYRFIQGQLTADPVAVYEAAGVNVRFADYYNTTVEVFVVPKSTGGAGNGSYAKVTATTYYVAGLYSVTESVQLNFVESK